MHQHSSREQEANDAITELHNDDGPCIKEKIEAMQRLKDLVEECLKELAIASVVFAATILKELD